MNAARLAVLAALSIAAGLASPSIGRGQDMDGGEGGIEYKVEGQYRVRGFALRNNSLVRTLDANTRLALIQAGIRDIDERQTFFDTRLRVKLSASLRNEVALNTQFEIGDLIFGGSGAQLGTDGVNVETKWLHLQYTPAAYPLTFIAGLYSEVTPKSLILSNDVAGFKGTYRPFDGKLTLSAELIKAIDNSRNDINNDGILDNDTNDRDIYIARVDINHFQPTVFGAYIVTDIDNTNDSPAGLNLERDVYWFGGYIKTRVGPVSLSADAIYAFGDIRNADPTGSVFIEGVAFDARAAFNLSVLGVEIIAGYGSGDNPNTRTVEAFPTITTFYAHSNIIFDDYGGFNVTGSSLSGITHISVLLTASPMEKLRLKGIFVYARYSADPRRNTNLNVRDLSGRDLGYEIGLNADYAVNSNFTLLTRSSILLPGTGYKTTFDSPDDGLLWETIIGAEFRF